MIARIKYLFLCVTFFTAISLIKKCIEACMWFEIDRADGVLIGNYYIGEKMLNGMAELHQAIEMEKNHA